MTGVSRRSPRKIFSYCSKSEPGDAQRAVEVGEGNRDVDEDRDDEEENREHDRRAEEDQKIRAPAGRGPRMAAPLDHQFIGCRRHRFGRSSRRPIPTVATESQLFHDDVFEARRRLVDHELRRIVRRKPPRLYALDRGIDDAVKLAELRIVWQEFCDLEQFGCLERAARSPHTADPGVALA